MDMKRTAATRIRILLTQSDIADLVGASRKRVNQAMVLFKEQGLIDTDAEGRISIKDRKGWRGIVDRSSYCLSVFIIRIVAHECKLMYIYHQDINDGI